MIISEYKLIVLNIMFLNYPFVMKEISPDVFLNPLLFKQLLDNPIDDI